MKKLKLSNARLSELFGQIALLTHAGISRGDGLTLLAEDEKDADMKERLVSMANASDNGESLSSAMENAECFPSHAIKLLRVGESVGREEETLSSLASYYEKRDRTERYLHNVLTYPVMLLMLMTVVIVILLTRILPIFDRVYASLGGSISGIGGMLLSVGEFLNGIMPLLCVIFVIAVLVFILIAVSDRVKGFFSRIWVSLFGDKGVSRKMADASFAQALSMALGSGMPIEDAISLSGELLSDRPKAKERIRRCLSLLSEGEELASALGRADLLPPSSCRLLALGLRAGNGDTTMEDIARRLSEDAEEALEAKLAKIEPAIVTVTSLLVGVILLSVMIPLMNIMSTLG